MFHSNKITLKYRGTVIWEIRSAKCDVDREGQRIFNIMDTEIRIRRRDIDDFSLPLRTSAFDHYVGSGILSRRE